MADIYRDFVYTRNTVATNETDTTITVEDVSLFPPTGIITKNEFFVAFESSLSYPHTFEIMRVTAVNVGLKQLTVVRGQGGTPAVPHPIATYIKGTLTSDMVSRLRSGIVGNQLPPNDSDGLYVGDRFYHLAEKRLYGWTGQTGALRDTFTRANSDGLGFTETMAGVPLATRTAWAPVRGVFGITNNAAVVRQVDSSNEAIALTNAGGWDVDISANLTLPEAGRGAGAPAADYAELGLVVRSSVNGSHGYLVNLTRTSASLHRRASGAYTMIASTTESLTDGATYSVRVVATGDVFRFYLNDTERFSFTETTVGFTNASNFSSIGRNLGFRASGAGAPASTAMKADNFAVDNPTNAFGGWQPLGPSGLQSIRDAENISTLVRHSDDMLEVVQTADLNAQRTGTALATVALHVDELLPLAQETERRSERPGVTAGTMAAAIDDLVDVLQGTLATGNGPPTTVSPRDGYLYFDHTSKRIYIAKNGTWGPLTYSGPGAATVYPTLVASSAFHSSSGTVTPPPEAQIGDMMIAAFNTANIGSSSPTPPSGWTLIGNSNVSSSYWNATCYFYKILAANDLGTTHTVATNNHTGLTSYRLYRNASFLTSSYTTGTGYGNYSTRALTTTKPKCLQITWTTGTNGTPANTSAVDPQAAVLDADGANSLHTQVSQHEEVSLSGTGTTPRTFSFTNVSGFTPAWTTVSMLIHASSDIQAAPALTGAGEPTPVTLGDVVVSNGSLYVDTNSNTLWFYANSAWRPALSRVVVATSSTFIARNGDYVLTRPTSAIAAFETSAANYSNGDVSVSSATSNSVYVGIRGTWDGTSASATISGQAMTMQRHQASGSVNAYLFTSPTGLDEGSHTLSFTGPFSSGVAANFGVVVKDATLSGASYVSALGNTATISTQPGQVLVLYAQMNSSTLPTISSTTTGVSWTRIQAGTSGNVNSMAVFQTVVPSGVTSVSATTAPTDSTTGAIIIASLPSGGGNLCTVTLPTTRRHVRVTVQNDDAGAETVVVPPTGSINGSANLRLSNRYQSGVFVCDGTNWFVTGNPTPPAPSSEVLLQTIRPGSLAVQTNLHPPGLRAQKATTLREMRAFVETAPTGSSLVLRFNKQSTDKASTTVIGDVTIAAGARSGNLILNGQASYQSVVLADGPAVYYEFNETSGAFQDSSGNGRHSNATTGVTYGRASLLRDGVGTSIEPGRTDRDGSVLNVSTLTVEAIIQTTSATVQQIWDRDDNTNRQFQFRTTTSGTLEFIGFPGPVHVTSGTTRIDDGLSHHVAAAVDANGIRLYVDGVLRGSSAAFTLASSFGTTRLALGYSASSGAPAQLWAAGGRIDEAAVYATALTEARIAAHAERARALSREPIAFAKGEFLTFGATAVGSTTPGADLLVEADFA